MTFKRAWGRVNLAAEDRIVALWLVADAQDRRDGVVPHVELGVFDELVPARTDRGAGASKAGVFEERPRPR